jgi:hypothetical protein
MMNDSTTGTKAAKTQEENPSIIHHPSSIHHSIIHPSLSSAGIINGEGVSGHAFTSARQLE